MNSKIILTVLIITIILSSCVTPRYLPSYDQLGVSRNGAFIRIKHEPFLRTNGELIAIDSVNIFVLSELSNKCEVIPLADLKSFTLRYAESKHYGWSIPVFILLPVTHGWFSAVTLPINLLTTVSVTASGEAAYKYKDDDLTIDELRMFARFPQGIPRPVKLEDIK